MTGFTLVPSPKPFIPSMALLDSAATRRSIDRPVLTRAHTTPNPLQDQPPPLGVHPQASILQLSPEERALIDPIASLASQHHLSEYSKLKFGPRGCPTLYFPLSITAPGHTYDLRIKQELNVAQPCFFIAPTDPNPRPHWASPSANDAPTTSSPTKRSMEVDELAIDAGGDRSTRSMRSPSIVAEPVLVAPNSSGQRRPVPVIHPPSSPQLEEALSLALTSPLPLHFIPQTIVLEQGSLTSAKPKTSESHPINISYLLPPESLPVISAHLASTYPHLLSNLHLGSGNPTVPPVDPLLQLNLPSSIWEVAFVPGFVPNVAAPLRVPPPLPSFTSQLMAPPPQALPTPHFVPSRPSLDRSFTAPPTVHPRSLSLSIPPPPPQMGNLLLSSCPGKKVRLTGPVKGRGAICRSLPQDLARIRSLGVKLVINCLDDTELEFLGSPWPEYASTAASLGIDVLRIPTPEGFSPLEPERLDALLEWVIRSYTLRGANILVHCRGGVGRAGLVAACWSIKMGLCGSIPHHDDGNSWEDLVAQGQLRRESFAVVQRVVGVVRRRRSVKAIETYEQARFLLDFVEFLRERKIRSNGSASPCLTGSRNSPCLTSSESGSEDTLVDLEILLPESGDIKAPGEDDVTPRGGKDLESPMLVDMYSNVTF